MSQTSSLPSYNILNTAIQKFQANGNVAQAHGLLCGFMCGNKDEAQANQWEELFPGIKKNKKVYELLQELIDISYQQLSEFSFEFNLLLPSEKIDLNIRAEALGLWCQGFLTGLNSTNVPIENREPSQVTEAIDDIIEISEINFGEIADNEEDEVAYVELVEYVRLSVLMIFQELRTDLPGRDNTSLH